MLIRTDIILEANQAFRKALRLGGDALIAQFRITRQAPVARKMVNLTIC